MKTISIFFILLFAFQSCLCQLSVVKQFDENEYICSYTNFEGVDLYATFNSSSNQIKIFDKNHQLQKSLTLQPNEYYNSVHIHGLSKDVFNSNQRIEFLIHTTDGKGQLKTKLMDDQNELLQNFNYAMIRTIGDKHYIVDYTSQSSYNQEIKEARTYRTDKIYQIEGRFRKIIY